MIRELRPRYPALPVHRMCQLLEVPRSLYYRKANPRPLRARFYEGLRFELGRLLGAHPGYGYRRARIELGRQGVKCGFKSVAKAMKAGGLAFSKKRAPRTSDGLGQGQHPNLLKGAAPDGPGQAFVADITYIGLPFGMACLAVVMDVFARKVVGHRLGRRIDSSLTLGALEDALSRRAPEPGWIHHSDRGSQYLCKDYVELVARSGGRVSASRKGCPTDNAFMESFFKTLKNEEVRLEDYESLEQARQRIGCFIEDYYNPVRQHSSLGYLSPDQFEASQPPPRPT